jgi:hypothetical protein
VNQSATLPFSINPSPQNAPQVVPVTGDITVQLFEQPSGGGQVFSIVTLETPVTGRPVTVDQSFDQDTPPQTVNP